MILKILFFIGLVFLVINVLRFIYSNIAVIKMKELHWAFKVWNIIETFGITIVLTILIINYYK